MNNNISKTKDKTVNIVINKIEKITTKTIIKNRNKTTSTTEKLRIYNNKIIRISKKKDTLKNQIFRITSTGT